MFRIKRQDGPSEKMFSYTFRSRLGHAMLSSKDDTVVITDLTTVTHDGDEGFQNDAESVERARWTLE